MSTTDIDHELRTIELDNIIAQTHKMLAETSKIRKETGLYGYVVFGSFIGGTMAATLAFAKWLL